MTRTLVAIALAAAMLSPAAAAPAPVATTKAVATLPTAQLGAEYRRLRVMRGHLQASSGDWNDDVDRFGGRKHVVMQELGARLAHATRARIVRAMGRPDAIAHPGDDLWQLAVPALGDGVLLVYYWRGGHDFLYFVARGDRIVAADWWMAYE